MSAWQSRFGKWSFTISSDSIAVNFSYHENPPEKLAHSLLSQLLDESRLYNGGQEMRDLAGRSRF